VRFILTGGNASDASFAIPLVIGLQARHVIADKAYDALRTPHRKSMKSIAMVLNQTLKN
jgi:hypothetical protein